MMDDTFEIIAYHKNEASTAAQNIRYQKFFISHDKENKEMWLGDGVYFWELPKDAEQWDRGKYLAETILEARITCPTAQFANLDKTDEMQEFQEFCKKTKQMMADSKGYGFNFQKGKYQVNSFFYNVFKETYDILLIKYSFPVISNRPQYCATNNDIISDIRLAANYLAGKWEWC